MIAILPLFPRLAAKLKKYSLEKKFQKQCTLLSKNPKHPSLHVELLEPKQHGIYSFRIDRKYRALFFFRQDNATIEIIAITIHYR